MYEIWLEAGEDKPRKLAEGVTEAGLESLAAILTAVGDTEKLEGEGGLTARGSGEEKYLVANQGEYYWESMC